MYFLLDHHPDLIHNTFQAHTLSALLGFTVLPPPQSKYNPCALVINQPVGTCVHQCQFLSVNATRGYITLPLFLVSSLMLAVFVGVSVVAGASSKEAPLGL